MTIEVNRDDEWVQVPPEELTISELRDSLLCIMLDSDKFIPQKEIDEGYAAIHNIWRGICRMGKQRKWYKWLYNWLHTEHSTEKTCYE